MIPSEREERRVRVTVDKGGGTHPQRKVSREKLAAAG